MGKTERKRLRAHRLVQRRWKRLRLTLMFGGLASLAGIAIAALLGVPIHPALATAFNLASEPSSEMKLTVPDTLTKEEVEDKLADRFEQMHARREARAEKRRADVRSLQGRVQRADIPRHPPVRPKVSAAEIDQFDAQD